MSLKNIILKSMASTMAVSILFGNVAICGVGISEAIAENQSAPEIKMELNNEKYVQYHEKDNAGVAIQSVFSIYPDQTRENYLPIKNAEVKLNLPSLNGHFPEKATVVEASMKATTGEEKSTKFSQNYDSDSGLLVLSYENTPNREGKMYDEFKENVKDKFEIIYSYAAEAYTGNDVDTKLIYAISGKMSFKTETGEVTSESSKKIELTEKENKGDSTTFNITDLGEEVYKGFLYSNVQNKTDYDTEYKTTSTLTVLNHQLVNELMMDVKESKFVLNDQKVTEIESDGKIVYQATSINKDEFDRMLGQEGMIEFYQGEEVLATVKYVEVEKDRKLAVIYLGGTTKILEDKETMLTVEHPENTTSLKIKTSKPIAEGFIHFENKNMIKAEKDYGCEIDQIKAIKTRCVVNEYENDTQISLLEPQTKMTVTSSNQNFSTLQKSKTTLTIGLDDTNARAKLFDNPVITVKLPEGLTGGNLSSPEIINGNGLKIKNATAKNNMITIELAGKQTEYDLKNVSGGVSIVMDIENIDFNDTLPTHTDKIEVTCSQGKEKNVTSTNVNIVSKAGLLSLSKLINYSEANEVASTIDNNVKTVEINNNAQAREAIHTLDLVNNYDEKITNVQIIGRLEKDHSTFSTVFTKPIEVNGINAKVYYSNNKDAKASDESWIPELTNDAKACKIVIENEELDKAKSVHIREYVQIPNNIEVNQESSLNWNTSYQYQGRNLTQDNTIKLTTKKDELMTNTIKKVQNIKTQDGKSIPVSLFITPVTTQNYVHSGQLVAYKISVTNNGTTDLHNLVLKDVIPENAIYTYYEEKEAMMANYLEIITDSTIKQKEWAIEELKAGSTIELEIMLTMADVQTEQETHNIINLEYDGQTIQTESKLTLKPSQIIASLETNSDDVIGLTYRAKEKAYYYIKVKNITDKDLKNVKVTYGIPEELTYVEGGLATYDEFTGYTINQRGLLNNNTFEFEIDKLPSGAERVIMVTNQVKQLDNIYSKKIDSIARVYINNELYETNVKTIETMQAAYELSLSVDTNGKEILQKNDELVYTARIKNIGNASSSIEVLSQIPEQLKTLKLEYDVNGKNKQILETSNQEIKLTNNLDVEDILTMKITAMVQDIEVEEDRIVDVANRVKLINGELEVESNEVSVKIKPELNVVEPEDPKPTDPENPTPVDPDNPDNPDPINPDDLDNPEDKERKYSISGIAWIDENKNGQRDESEKLQDSVVVSLVNKETGNFALDENGNKITTTTDTNGNYTFSNIPEGNYIVIFEFDTNTYTVTTYQKAGVETPLNSDAILSTVTIDGQRKVVAITDTITINSNKENIDIGLMMNADFDLSLNKQITKITVSNSKGTEVTEYEDGETAKIDLVAKYMNTAKVIVNYKFTIKNEGDVIGYVDSLVDNLPSGLEFSSDLNKEWYKGNDGKLYTTALASKAIRPGESAEIELILTKTMTEESTGTFPNSAELDKISNLENISEKTEVLENNQSSALLIISIKTGSVVLYMGITLLSIGILAVGAYMIKKKVLDRGI